MGKPKGETGHGRHESRKDSQGSDIKWALKYAQEFASGKNASRDISGEDMGLRGLRELG